MTETKDDVAMESVEEAPLAPEAEADIDTSDAAPLYEEEELDTAQESDRETSERALENLLEADYEELSIEFPEISSLGDISKNEP